MGAATASLLTNLFTNTDPNETEQQKQAKENLVDTLVAGIATATGSSSASTTVNAAQAEVENNWLATQQIVQAKKDWNACNGNALCQMKTAGKWAGVSFRQDVLTTTGVGKGLAQAGFTDLQGIAQFLADPTKGLTALYQIVSDPSMASAAGKQVIDSVKQQITQMQQALTEGGDANAQMLGENLGNLMWQVGSLVTGVGGAAKASVELAGAGIRLGSQMLDDMGMLGRASLGANKAESIAATLNNFYRDGASPELVKQAYSQAALSSTHNASSSEVVLGRYIAGSADSYDVIAQSRGATYFSMSDWNAVQGQMGAENMWNINKAFLDQQMVQGKSFVFTANPELAPAQSYTRMELNYLKSSGYDLSQGNGGYFYAIKK
ncbi:hypothetical protein R69658_08052 [Paraburkholderia aspalathi]|uniref:Hemagglutinin n=1 Tax=Paraburkholderia aspalathi TaxID=1324617 RepID=A0ABN7NBX8_9BURK|nr:hypothetical protein R69658_08052 [Paraburkholderia aspalathi]